MTIDPISGFNINETKVLKMDWEHKHSSVQHEVTASGKSDNEWVEGFLEITLQHLWKVFLIDSKKVLKPFMVHCNILSSYLWKQLYFQLLTTTYLLTTYNYLQLYFQLYLYTLKKSSFLIKVYDSAAFNALKTVLHLRQKKIIVVIVQGFACRLNKYLQKFHLTKHEHKTLMLVLI